MSNKKEGNYKSDTEDKTDSDQASDEYSPPNWEKIKEKLQVV